jgi:DNA invertase Pin-like site-specific DNA recombinase
MNAIAYVRVSTDHQADSGLGLAAQVATIESYAKVAGHTITAVHTDAGISGAAGIEDRPGLAAAVAGLRRGDVLVIAKRCRLGRDQLAVLMIERAVAKRGAAIVSADGVGNGDDAASVFMKQVVDAAAVYERNLIKARTKAALAAKRKAGQLAGEVPFGWTVDAAGNLIEVAEEQIVLGRIMACRAAGISLRKIAAILTDAGVATKKGGTVWVHTTIKSILERAAAVAA